LYVTDNVDTFVKSVVHKNLGICKCSKFYCNKCGDPPTVPEEKRVRGQKSLKTTALTYHHVYSQRERLMFYLGLFATL